MLCKGLAIIIGLSLGVLLGIYLVLDTPLLPSKPQNPVTKFINQEFTPKQVIGFLPYWLVSKTQTDYSPYITTLTYFGLTVGADGSIVQQTNPGESEPGWYFLTSGRADEMFKNALNHQLKLSLLIFAGKEDSINGLVQSPVSNAQTLVSEVSPIMQKYNFTDLNLDIESTKTASDAARLNFALFAQEVKRQLQTKKLGTLTIEVSPDNLIHHGLIDLSQIEPVADYVVLMAYDYHYTGSAVTGPVAPLLGAGTISEYDTQVAVQNALQSIPSYKLILGIPVYGYEWETLQPATRSATIPSSGLIASTARVEELIQECTNCTVSQDQDAQENFLIFQDMQTNTFHQIFYPDNRSTQAKINYANSEKLGGLAVWALGYESSNILKPLKSYK
ncbi:glycosyl hydrolase family 18 protein [Patescibacteria group bacterium]|nr:glycosyl hydrolase family 18 protein [Patescibacteria group bacterium]